MIPTRDSPDLKIPGSPLEYIAICIESILIIAMMIDHPPMVSSRVFMDLNCTQSHWLWANSGCWQKLCRSKFLARNSLGDLPNTSVTQSRTSQFARKSFIVKCLILVLTPLAWNTLLWFDRADCAMALQWIEYIWARSKGGYKYRTRLV